VEFASGSVGRSQYSKKVNGVYLAPQSIKYLRKYSGYGFFAAERPSVSGALRVGILLIPVAFWRFW